MPAPLTPLRDILLLADAGTWGTDGDSMSGAPVLRSTNIADYRLDLGDVAWRTLPPGHRSSKRLETGDILVTASSGSSEHIGKCCLFEQPEDDRPFYFSNFTLRLRVDSHKANPRWLYHWLKSDLGRANLTALNSTTSGLRNLNKTLYVSQKLSVPPLAEQRRIAAVLDKADGIRRKRRETLRLLDQLLQSGYSTLVGARHPDYHNWPLSQVADLAASPASMRTGPFGSSLRHSEFVDRGIAVLGIDNAVQNRFAWAERRYITEKKYEKFKRYTVRPGDVIVTIMGTTGRSAVVPDDNPLAISTKHLAVITVDHSRVHPQFLSHAFHSDQTVLAQISAANRGAIMSGLNLGIIKRVRIRLPPLAAQRRFAYLVGTVSETRDRLTQASVEVDGLFDSLAQRAFRGVL